MKKKTLEIFSVIGSFILMFVLILLSSNIKGYSGYGYVVSLVIFIIVMGYIGLYLTNIPDK